MKAYIQWTQRTPRDWVKIDSRDWSTLPRLPEPVSGSHYNAEDAGYAMSVCIQGITFSGFDRYYVEDLDDESGGVRVTCVNDNPNDWPAGHKHAHVWTLWPLASDPTLGGAMNTRQFRLYYTEDDRRALLPSSVQNTVFRKWSDFQEPDRAKCIHGVMVNDGLLHAHHQARATAMDWRDWTEHLPDSEKDENGKLKEQRARGRFKPNERTITWYQRDTASAQGWVAASNENALSATTAASATQSVSVPKNTTNQTCWSFMSPSSEPNVGDWPNGTYRAQLDCTVCGADETYAVKDATGGFCNVNSTGGTRNSFTSQAESDFSGTGLKLATASWNPAAGAASDRYVIAVVVSNASMSSAETITLRFNTTDSFADGPWNNVVVSDTTTLSESRAQRLDADVRQSEGVSTVNEAQQLQLVNDISRTEGAATVSDSAQSQLAHNVNPAEGAITGSEALAADAAYPISVHG